MKITDIISDYSQYMIIIIILILTTFSVSKIQFNNGKIASCKNSDMEYFQPEDRCYKCEDIGGRFDRYGRCIIREDGQPVTFYDMKNLDPFYPGDPDG